LSIKQIRNIAIIAHVDHGKTTLVDKLLQQSGTFGDRGGDVERVMDSNDLEKERGITILAKNTAIKWTDPRDGQEYGINIVDTPGHADFGGEVERVLSMVDSVCLLVDSVDGPMPQTRFVTMKAFARGLKPIVVLNKVDRPSARPHWVMDQVFELFDNLGATDEQLDFPVVYASGLNGISGYEADKLGTDMTALFQTIIDRVAPPEVDVDGPFQMQISSLDYNSYVGVIGIGRITRGRVKTNTQVTIVDSEGKRRNGRILQIMGYHGLNRVEVPEADAGDIICVTGMEGLGISDTLCDPQCVEALPLLSVDEPTVSMTFQVNNSPFAGREGKYVTSRNIKDRLEKELIHNGRGELHLSVLIENMRREGFEMGVSRPEVIFKEVDGVKCEPFENVIFDVEEQHQGGVMEQMGTRRGDMTNMILDGKGRIRIEATVPSRGLIGFRSEFLTMTSGTGIMTASFSHYGALKSGDVAKRQNGVLISMVQGVALGYALWNLQERGRLHIGPQTEVYEGMIIGLNSRNDDMAVNPTKAKQLTNVRASGTDENIVLTPPIRFTLEQALEFIEDDELVEVTPKSIRLRKRHLTETDRKRASRN
jgi:GTP-binding protein